MSAPDPRLRAVAVAAVVGVIKRRARAYAERPAGLESLFPGLGTFPPRRALAVLASLEERECGTPRRHVGFGGEVMLVNIRAARLAARHARRFARELEAA